jgi:hypothetical protein
MFQNCASLVTVPLFNLANVQNAQTLFNGCRSLTTVPALNLAGINSAANGGTVFASCPSLSSARFTGLRFTFSIINCRLSGAALNEIYTNLPTVTGQTITVTGNYGTATDTPSIATAKGWTVSG